MTNISLNQVHQLRSAREQTKLIQGLTKLASAAAFGKDFVTGSMWDGLAGNDWEKFYKK